MNNSCITKISIQCTGKITPILLSGSKNTLNLWGKFSTQKHCNNGLLAISNVSTL